MNTEIQQWLGGTKDYSLGVHLYDQYGTSNNLKRLFSRQEATTGTLETLVYELSKLIDQQPPAAAIRRRPEPAVSRQANKEVEFQQPVTDKNDVPAEFRNLQQEIRMQWKALDSLHATLEFVGKDQCRINALLILDIAEELDFNYQRKFHYEKHKELPPPKEGKAELPEEDVSKLNLPDLIRKRASVRSHVSRFKGYIANPEKASALDHNKASLVKWERLLVIINDLLK